MTLVSRALSTVPQSWLFNCEKGGIRRVLMNLLGNSLKFTSVTHFLDILYSIVTQSFAGWLRPCQSEADTYFQ